MLGQAFDLDVQYQVDMDARQSAQFMIAIVDYQYLSRLHEWAGPKIVEISDAFQELAWMSEDAGDVNEASKYRVSMNMLEDQLQVWVIADQARQEWGATWNAMSQALNTGITMDDYQTGGLAGIGQVGIFIAGAVVAAALVALVAFNRSTTQSGQVATEMQEVLMKVKTGELTPAEGVEAGLVIKQREIQRTDSWLPEINLGVGVLGMAAIGLGVYLMIAR